MQSTVSFPQATVQLTDTPGLVIKQRVELGEAIFGIETRNRYEVSGVMGGPNLIATEEAKGLWGILLRQLLRGWRPFRIEVRDTSGNLHYTFTRPFRLFFFRLDVKDANGRPLGFIERRLTWVRRRYVMRGASGGIRGEIFGPLLKPWTFEIQVRNRVLGTIRKKWSGLSKEFFTEADNFGVEFQEGLDERDRALCFGATFLIDFAHFEK